MHPETDAVRKTARSVLAGSKSRSGLKAGALFMFLKGVF
jgi:hypothetical protein